jgi:hypothetical protein
LPGESENRVIDAVPGNNANRPLRSETTRKKGSSNCADLLQQLGITEFTPTFAGALGYEDAIRRLLSPLVQPHARIFSHWAERNTGSQKNRSIRPVFADNIVWDVVQHITLLALSAGCHFASRV